MNLANKGLPASPSRDSVVLKSLPYQELRVSCLAQSHLSLLCIPCVKVRVWWDLPEDGHQLLSRMPPMQTLVEKNKQLPNITDMYNIYIWSPSKARMTYIVTFALSLLDNCNKLTLCLSHLLCVARETHKVISLIGNTEIIITTM